jgi:putative ABC transport system permease protein
MLVQLGLLLGLFGTVTVLVDRGGADLWVTSPETKSFDQARDIPGRMAPLLLLRPDVTRTEAVLVEDAEWRSGTSTRVSVLVVGIEPSGDALACPAPMRDELCAKLAEPMSVVIDRSDAQKLGARSGDLAELNRKRVRIVGLSNGLQSIGSSYVFASSRTVRAVYETPAAGDATFLLAKLGSPSSVAEARDSLQSLFRRSAYRVWTRDEFSNASQRYWLFESGVGIGFLFSSILGLTVGVVITSQTLRAVILGSIREYATFRAIGVPPSRLGAVVLEQSLWIGVLGAALTLAVSALAGGLARLFSVPLVLTWWSVLLALSTGVLTGVSSGVLAFRELYRLEPAELLR